MTAFTLARNYVLAHDSWYRMTNWRGMHKIAPHHETTALFKDLTRDKLEARAQQDMGGILGMQYFKVLEQVDLLNKNIDDRVRQRWEAMKKAHTEMLVAMFPPDAKGRYVCYDHETSSTLTFLLKNEHFANATLARDESSVFGYVDIVTTQGSEHHCRFSVNPQGGVYFTTAEDFM